MSLKISVGKGYYRLAGVAGIWSCLLLSVLLSARPATAQQPDRLGTGMLVFRDGPLPGYDTFTLYRDTACLEKLMLVVPEMTNCPRSPWAAEPESFFDGPVDPFICGSANGMQFICTRSTASYHEIYIDTTATMAYVKAGRGKYFSWDAYFRNCGEKGDYYTFNRSYNNQVLYDRPYALESLPVPGKDFLVGLHLDDLEDLRFYPVHVEGYWMKLRIMNDDRKLGHCWVIWRSETEWLIGFRFRPE